ncbi:MAG TPA: hypothetical protein DEB05_04315 [Firmicutes bacterium]|nr:hypothetical protein [Bacillota bacterium]
MNGLPLVRKEQTKTTDQLQAGFTLLEVLLAMLIMGIGFAVLTEGLLGGRAGVDRNYAYTLVAIFAENKLNEIASGIELNSQGEFKDKKICYSWRREEIVTSELSKEIIIHIEWPSQEGKGYYTLRRLVYDRNGN